MIAPKQQQKSLSQQSRDYEFNPADFDRVRQMIHERAGINLNETKINMVYGRLARRLRVTGHRSFTDYLNALESHGSGELQEFVNALTTNLTYFFREEHHFPLLSEFVMAHKKQTLKIWCCAASTGEEAYSIGMTVAEAVERRSGPRLNATIFASDIDTAALATAERGIYNDESIQRIPVPLLKKYFQQGRGENVGMARVKQNLQQMITFGQINLLQPSYGITESVDIIFCRNVMIYFDKSTQNRVLEKMAGHLTIGGLLFAGHSENFVDSRENYRLRSKTVYERVSGRAGDH